MTDKIVLVAGGAGLVGEAIVRALCVSPAVAHVFVSSRSARRLANLSMRLAELGPRATLLVGDAGDPAGGAELAAAVIARRGRLDAAVASLGAGAADGRRLLDIERAAYEASMHALLGAHVAFARAVVPQLANDGTYLGIGGGAAFAPVPGAGVMSIAAAGQVMLTRVLDAERTRPNLTIRELVVNAAVGDAAQRHEGPAIAPCEVAGVVEELLRTGTSTWPRLRRNGPIVTMDPRPRDA